MRETRRAPLGLTPMPALAAGLALALALFLAPPATAAETPPGAARDAATHQRLEAAYDAKGPGHRPRTALMRNGRARFVNRLIEAASPYLLQHAHNPVDWRPWGDAALAEARARDLPIFLSVGYATCHWCHVMAEESFDDIRVAAALNPVAIPIKVDREEMPALDHLYLTATRLAAGAAGWPNTVFLTPDGRPFRAATYLPRADLLALIDEVGAAWRDPAGRRAIEAEADALSAALAAATRPAPAGAVEIDEAVYARAAAGLVAKANLFEGGFSDTLQFPEEVILLFLLDHWRRTGDTDSLEAVKVTLDAIAAGGLHDHVGGGFHRYAVDPGWRAPHFEKMLYTQAQLARAFVEGWEVTREPAWARAARRALAYVLDQMRDEAGAFYAAEDAVSPGADGRAEEGAFYLWRREEAAALLPPDMLATLGLDAAPGFPGGAVIRLDPEAAQDFEALDAALARLAAARAARPRPLRDQKVIAGWNGLMIRALAEAAVAFDAPALSRAAARAGDAVWERLWADDGLKRFWAAGAARGAAALEDHAWLALGYLALAEATGAPRWDARADQLAAAILARFGAAGGRLRMAAADGPLGPLFDDADDAVPSGESAALELFAQLSQRRGDPVFGAEARRLAAALSAELAARPLARPRALGAVRLLQDGPAGRRQVRARGKVRLRFGEDALRIEIAEGWHLNAHDPGQDWLIGAALEGAAARWPEGETALLGFSQEAINVYSGTLDIPFDRRAETVTLSLQACSDTVCLAPETATARFLGP